MRAAEYMMELVNYGGVLVPRGYVIQLLRDLAGAQGHNKAEAKVLADRWMQGYDTRQRIQSTRLTQT